MQPHNTVTYINRLHPMANNSIFAVIMGGGQGTRLYPLTKSRSKPAVPIAGKYRLVDIPISNCLNSGVNRIFVLTQFNSASLNSHIKNTYHFNHFAPGFVEILAAEQTPDNPQWYQGTADAVRQSLHHLYNHEFDYVLILSGDQLYQMDFQDMLKQHLASKSDISIATIPCDAHDATAFGIMKVNAKNQVTDFIEKPAKELLENWVSPVSKEMQKEGRTYLASMGIYLFNKKVLMDLLTNYAQMKDFGKEIIPNAIHNNKVSSYAFEGYWTDIGNIHSFYEANLELVADLPKFNLFDKTHPVFTRARLLPPSKISGTALEKAIIADGCIISASRLVNVVIGIRTRIGKGTTIEDSYVMGNDYYETLDQILKAKKNKPAMGIGERCYLKNCIVDKNVRIGNDVKIIGSPKLKNADFETHTIVEGIVVVKKGAVLPNGTTIG